MNDNNCEECGAEATRTVHGICLCDSCEFGAEELAEPSHWAIEVPAGLLDGDEDLFDDAGGLFPA